MQVGRRIYYEKSTGNVIIDTGERSGNVRETTVEEDFTSYVALTERVRDSVDYIQLEYGQFAQDFTECNGYRVNPETRTMEFSYPDPSAPVEPPVYQRPLTEECAELREQLALTNADLQGFMDYYFTNTGQ